MKKTVEGQMDIFEAMDRAAAAVDRMVEEDAAKKKKKSRGKAPAGALSAGTPSTGTSKEAPGGSGAAPAERSVIYGMDMHASMQKTFVNPADDDFATVAYIDYNMIYWKEWNAPAALRVFGNSREAVDFYMEQLMKLRDCAFAESTAEHEPFRDMKCVAEHVYTECED